MSIQPVQENTSGLRDGIKSATIGGLIGYASKYALPLTSQEMDPEYKNIIALIKQNSTKAKNSYLNKLKLLESTTLSQDIYVKSAEKFAKNNIKAYNFALKSARPTAPFIATGIAIGFLVSFIKQIFRTDIN